MTTKHAVLQILKKHDSLLIPDIATLGCLDKDRVERAVKRSPWLFTISRYGLVRLNPDGQPKKASAQ